jgi:hypothetical protein
MADPPPAWQPGAASDWFTRFRDNWLLGLLGLDLMIVIGLVLSVPVYLTVLCWRRSERRIEIERTAVLDPGEQRLHLRWRGQRRPRAPIPPEHDPWLQPGAHLPQRGWPAHPWSLPAPALLVFFPAQRPRSAHDRHAPVLSQRPSTLVSPPLPVPAATSRTKRRTTPAPNAAASPRHSALDTRPSRGHVSLACSSARPTSAGHTAAPPRPGSPAPMDSSLPARSPLRGDW